MIQTFIFFLIVLIQSLLLLWKVSNLICTAKNALSATITNKNKHWGWGDDSALKVLTALPENPRSIPYGGSQLSVSPILWDPKNTFFWCLSATVPSLGPRHHQTYDSIYITFWNVCLWNTMCSQRIKDANLPHFFCVLEENIRLSGFCPSAFCSCSNNLFSWYNVEEHRGIYACKTRYVHYAGKIHDTHPPWHSERN